MVSWPNQEGSDKIPTFCNFFSQKKNKFALELSINVVKHTLHKWRGNISSIYNVIETIKKTFPPHRLEKITIVVVYTRHISDFLCICLAKNTSYYIFLGVLQAMLANFNKRDLNKSKLKIHRCNKIHIQTFENIYM